MRRFDAFEMRRERVIRNAFRGVTLSIVTLLTLTLPFSIKSASAVSEEEIRQHVHSLYITINGVDAILDDSLSSMSSIVGFRWLDVFKIIVTTDRVADKIRRGEYGLAVVEAGVPIFEGVAARQAHLGRLAAVAPVARLAALPIELALNKFAQDATNAAINWQIDRYFQVRSQPFNKGHQFVIDSEDDLMNGVFFSDQGWLWMVGDTSPRSYRPSTPPHPYTPRKIYELANGLYEAHAAMPRGELLIASLKDEFRQVLLEQQSPPAPEPLPSGQWVGEYSYHERGALSPVWFTLQLDVDRGRLRGHTMEPATFGDGSSLTLYARIEGTAGLNNEIVFTKTYDGTAGVLHSVDYKGRFDPVTRVVMGTWRIGGKRTGSFRMSLKE